MSEINDIKELSEVTFPVSLNQSTNINGNTPA